MLADVLELEDVIRFEVLDHQNHNRRGGFDDDLKI